MLKTISIYSTNFLIDRNQLLKPKKNIYIYGFEIIYSTLFCTISILLFGLLLKQIPQTLTFLLVFSLGRVLAGGFHASTYRNCYILTMLCFLFTQFLSYALTQTPFLQMIILLFSVFYLGLNGPVYSAKKAIKLELYLKHKKTLLAFLSVISILTILFILNTSFFVSSEISSTLFMVTILFFIKQKEVLL